jgi:DNA-binding NtrC family response regulator
MNKTLTAVVKLAAHDGGAVNGSLHREEMGAWSEGEVSGEKAVAASWLEILDKGARLRVGLPPPEKAKVLLSHEPSSRRPTRLLLWDFHSDNVRSDDFHRLLDGHALFEATVVSSADPEKLRNSFESLAESDALVLVVGLEQLQNAAERISILRATGFRAPVFVASETDCFEDFSRLLLAGATDVLTFPWRASEVFARVARWVWTIPALKSVQDPHPDAFSRILGQSPAILAEVEKARRYAARDSAVLILGETGTGKEVFARAIHDSGPRADKPFVAWNCASTPHELVENELFGHEPGAFTGARSAQLGLIEQARGGTILLDEINSFPLAAQPKLLRLLQEGEYRRLGSAQTRRADVRFLCAANVALAEAVHRHEFRQDLYYRLDVLRLSLPPLRERREDIPLLAANWLLRSGSGPHFPLLSASALNALMHHEWPGNVRELGSVLERAIAASSTPLIEAADLDILGRSPQAVRGSLRARVAFAKKQCERQLIIELLTRHQGNVTHAASEAGIDRGTFHRLLRKHLVGGTGIQGRHSLGRRSEREV